MAIRLMARFLGSREALIVAAALATVLLAAAVVIPYAYVTSRESLYTDAEIGMVAAAQDAADSADSQFLSAWTLIDRIIQAQLYEHDPEQVQSLFFALASFSVRRQAQVSATYIGFPDGSFLMSEDLVPREVTDAGLADKLEAQMEEQTGFHRIIDRRPGGGDHWYYRNKSLAWTRIEVAPVPYDPRTRPWYQGAVARDGAFWSDPYIFVSTRAPGITLAVPIKDASGKLWGVVGADIGLAPLSRVIDQFRRVHLGLTGFVFIGDGSGRLLSHPGLVAYIDRMPADAGMRSI
jgi:hypothetical protein